MFPSSIVANTIDLKDYELFQANDSAQIVPNIAEAFDG
jgi:hypothetical protein